MRDTSGRSFPLETVNCEAKSTVVTNAEVYGMLKGKVLLDKTVAS